MVKGFLHVGISVRNLEESVRFYTEVLGMEKGIQAHHEGDVLSQVIAVENAEVDVRYVTKGTHLLELIEYKNKDQAKLNNAYKSQDDPGLVHIAFKIGRAHV